MQMIAQLNQNIWVVLILSINYSTFYLLSSYFTVNMFHQLPRNCTIVYNSIEQFNLVKTGKIEFNRYIQTAYGPTRVMCQNLIFAHGHQVNCPTR